MLANKELHQSSQHQIQVANSMNAIAPGSPFRFLIGAIVCLISCSSIFILSGESAVIGGYQARGLSSTWFAFALFLCAILPSNLALRKIWFYCLGVFLVICTLCFAVERNQTIKAWQLQLYILEQANHLIAQNKVPSGATIMADVPHYLNPNFNHEIVFSQPWDFGAALAITNQNNIKAGPVIDSSRGELRQLRLQNGHVFAENFSASQLQDFWIYRFDASTKQSSLTPINSEHQFEDMLEKLKKSHEIIQP